MLKNIDLFVQILNFTSCYSFYVYSFWASNRGGEPKTRARGNFEGWHTHHQYMKATWGLSLRTRRSNWTKSSTFDLATKGGQTITTNSIVLYQAGFINISFSGAFTWNRENKLQHHLPSNLPWLNSHKRQAIYTRCEIGSVNCQSCVTHISSLQSPAAWYSSRP